MKKNFEISLPFEYSINGLMKNGYRVFYVDFNKVDVRDILNKVNNRQKLTQMELDAMKCDLTDSDLTSRRGWDMDQNELEHLREQARALLVK